MSVGDRTLTRLARLSMPTIAAVEGFAVGVAWSLVRCCDVVVTAEDAFSAAPFPQRGMAPDGGLAWFLTRSLGPTRAAELLMPGERFPAPTAAAAGLVNRVVLMEKNG
ncbi:enoyl-CoA hydratase/isomerase family protein [Saccharomonospora marina]|uniref:enoyl-CoA hydratase/isomerase family protein n=1 Tax=Saccharomonospora marina TaxID=632569 RepID=UPI000687FDEA|nr:enoyl-CoA hydratase/isomerase family protein [Saccharomonospora marina]